MSDRRTLFANDRVAHVSLRGRVDAARFAEGEAMQVVAPVADLRRTPTATAPLERQLLAGTQVRVLEQVEGVSFLRDEATGYVGYVDSSALGPVRAPTHRVRVRTTLAFAEPSIKTPGPLPLSLGSRVAVIDRRDPFLHTPAGYIPADHLAPLEQVEADPVAVAERLLGAPYLWGGNSAFGLDCSGLVQIALTACGRDCPGDSDQQEAALGPSLPEGTAPRRGDLMFWKGHVAWLSDAETLLHANAFAMAVAHEPLDSALARIEAQGEGRPTAHIRP